MGDKATKESNESQKYIREIRRINARFGKAPPQFINMYFAAKLEFLTRVLIVVTVVLAILTGIYLILLVKGI